MNALVGCSKPSLLTDRLLKPGAQRYREGVKYKEVNPDDCEDKSVLYKVSSSAYVNDF